MNDVALQESGWSTQERLAAQASVDRAAKSSGSDDALSAALLNLLSQVSGRPDDEQLDKRGALTSWAAALRGATLGRFVIEDLLGHGGFGVVLRAFDGELQRHVAIKIPRPDVLARSDARQRFLEEARVVAMLRHPGIVQVHDMGSAGPLTYIASELCRGETLRDWLAAQATSVEPRRAAKIVMELADTMGYAHSRGVIHQDLKPGNVLIDRPASEAASNNPGPLRVTDFGLARRLSSDDGTLSIPVGGTRRYMAPEQTPAGAHQVGTHTDVYALGVMLAELLLWQSTNRASNDPQVGSSELPATDSATPLPNSRPRHVPKNLWAICRKCVQPEPADRYRHATELCGDLKRFLDCEPVLARRVGPVERGVLACRKRPVLAGLIGAVIVSTVVGVAGVVWQWRAATWQTSIAEQRLVDSEALLVRMSWALDESYFWNDTPYEFESDFRRELARDFAALVLNRNDTPPTSRPAVAAALRRMGHEAFERNDFVTGERLTQASLANWRSVRLTDPTDRVYRRSAALAAYYLTLYGFSSGKEMDPLLTMDREQLVPGFSWQTATDLELTEDLARLLQARALALEKIGHFPAARTTHAASAMLWQQLREHRVDVLDDTIEFAREHAAMGICDAREGNHRRARTELLQAGEVLSPLLRPGVDVGPKLRTLWIETHQSAARSLAAVDQHAEAERVLRNCLARVVAMGDAPGNDTGAELARLESQLAELTKR